jgi:hypothetical protein
MPYADPEQARQRRLARYRADPELFRQRSRDNYAADPERVRARVYARRRTREPSAVAARRLAAVPEPVPFTGDLRWLDQAACAGLDTEVFFRQHVSPAVQELCEGCPVRAECLGMALAFPAVEVVGMWAGTTAQDRRQMRRRGA